MTADGKNPLYQLLALGQSVWLDSIRRGQIKSGELKKLIDTMALRGETANPSIFEKAIGGSADYDDEIREAALQGLDANAIYEQLATDDVRMACDVFRPVYDASDGADGFVSIEVSPKLAYDTQGTLEEARRLWKRVDRPNLFVKIPGTPEGVPAIEEALYEGININITLLFAVSAYEAVAWAFVRALERRLAEGKPIHNIASVASFFVSRIDTLADKWLDDAAKEQPDPQRFEELNDLKGKLAIANAKVAYESFKRIFSDARYELLHKEGARVQRPLWASTSTKNPSYRDVMYVETLIGPDTVNTLPLETIEAFADHGVVSRTVDKDLEAAHDVIRRFEAAGFTLQAVTDQVLSEGVVKFDEALDKLLEGIEAKRAEFVRLRLSPAPDLNSLRSASLGEYSDAVRRALNQVSAEKVAQRIWARDASLWTADVEHQEKIRERLGWLSIAREMQARTDELKAFANEVANLGFKHVLLLGMGGSSLAPEVMYITFGLERGHPNFGVLDTTDPATVRAFLREMHPTETLYIVSSKSGTTLETDSFYDYFYGQLHALRGDRAGRNFVAITDSGTPLEKLATERGFRRIFLNPPDIGGRYSALSYFGLVPAALIGVDLKLLLDRAIQMMDACAGDSAATNPGLWLGAILGEMCRQGRDKVTFFTSHGIDKFGYWVEQLIAESTGKSPESGDGNAPRGLVPIEGEPIGAPSVYGSDRVFVYLRLDGANNDALDQGVAELEKAGQPVIRLQLRDNYDLGAEFFRWEFATAVAGAQLGINPFDEPDVAESKENTNKVLEFYQEGCKLPDYDPDAVRKGIAVFWNKQAPDTSSLDDDLDEFLGQLRPGDYVALLVFLTRAPANDKSLTAMRVAIRARYKVATTAGYGPRYLHSTGQLHKGGGNNGVFIVITGEDVKDVKIPGQTYTFGILKEAQALGDWQSLAAHQRRALRVNLTQETTLSELQRVLESTIDVEMPSAAEMRDDGATKTKGDGADLSSQSPTATKAGGKGKSAGKSGKGKSKSKSK